MIRLLIIACLLLASCGGSSPIPPATAQPSPVATPSPIGGMQTEWTQYRNSIMPTENLSADFCGWPGRALTSSSTLLFPAQLRPVVRAHWLLVFAPRGGTVQLVAADDGPSNLSVLVESAPSEHPTAWVQSIDVTAQVNDLIAERAHHKQIILRICGPSQVYSSTIYVVW